MQYLAAYTLATLSGSEPTEASLTAILNSTGKPVDAAQVKAVIQSLKGKQVHELITKGQSKIGGGSAAPAAKGGKDEKKDDKKKEQKKPQPKKEQKKAPEPEPEEEDLNIDLFG